MHIYITNIFNFIFNNFNLLLLLLDLYLQEKYF